MSAVPNKLILALSGSNSMIIENVSQRLARANQEKMRLKLKEE